MAEPNPSPLPEIRDAGPDAMENPPKTWDETKRPMRAFLPAILQHIRRSPVNKAA